MTTSRKYDDETAVKIMREANFEPLEPYSGLVHNTWRSRCIRCGHESAPRLWNVRNGSRCRPCAMSDWGMSVRGKGNVFYKTGRSVTKSGYVLLSSYHDHPNAQRKGVILEHVLIMANKLGRPLLKGETVHHKNGKRNDNRLKNLELWSSGQPPGQRVKDKVAWAVELLQLYAPEKLK